MTSAIQDAYPERYAHCYGCGPANPDGRRLKSYLEGDEVVARHTPAPDQTGGVPDHVYGGLIASLLDCHGAAAASAFAHRDRGLELGGERDQLRFVTGTLTVRYLRPTPMGVELAVRGRLASAEGRKVVVDLELSAGGEACARGEMVAIEIPPRL